MLTDFEKAKRVLKDNAGNLKNISDETDIPFSTVAFFAKNPAKLKTAAWIRVHKIANTGKKEKGVTDLEKARFALADRNILLKDISTAIGASYPVVRAYSSQPKKLETASWVRVHRMAELYEKAGQMYLNDLK